MSSSWLNRLCRRVTPLATHKSFSAATLPLCVFANNIFGRRLPPWSWIMVYTRVNRLLRWAWDKQELDLSWLWLGYLWSLNYIVYLVHGEQCGFGLYLPRAIIIVICIPIQWSSTASVRAAAHLNKQLNFTNSYFGIPNMWSVSFANTLATIRTSDAYLNGHEEIMGLVIKVALDGMQIRHTRREWGVVKSNVLYHFTSFLWLRILIVGSAVTYVVKWLLHPLICIGSVQIVVVV